MGGKLNSCFTKMVMGVASTQWYSTSLLMKKLLIKTTVKPNPFTRMNKDTRKHQLELSYSAGGSVTWCSHFWKIIWHYLLKLDICISYGPAILLLWMYPTEYVCMGTKRYVQNCSQKHNSQQPKTRHNPNVHQQQCR